MDNISKDSKELRLRKSKIMKVKWWCNSIIITQI